MSQFSFTKPICGWMLLRYYIIEGSLEVKLPTIWTDRWKSRGVKSQGGKEKKWEGQRRERERRKKMQVRKKGRKVAIHCVFSNVLWLSAQTGRKVAIHCVFSNVLWLRRVEK